MIADGRRPGPIAGRDEAATASGTQAAGGEGEDGSVAGTQATLAADGGTLPTPPWPHWAGGSGLLHRPRGLNHQAASGNSAHTDMAAMRSVMATARLMPSTTLWMTQRELYTCTKPPSRRGSDEIRL